MPRYNDAEAARVARGAALLDSVDLDWFHCVDLDQLDLADCGACMLGQLYGHYVAGLDYLVPVDWDYDQRDRWAVRHGFEAPSIDGLRTRYDQLTEAWAGVIVARRATAQIETEETA